MLDRILSGEQIALLKEERAVLSAIRSELTAQEAPEDDRKALDVSIEQLDDLFLVVVVGEFNSGKSTLLNALIGERVLADGVTPTTSQIHVIRWGESPDRTPIGEGREAIALPVPMLKELTLVDTPGTNALDRHHEALTDDFVPRSDLVLFVTSADRPMSESERQFLQRVREWGKKVVVVVNKIDILPAPEAVDEVMAYVREKAEEMLAVKPEVFGVSAARSLADPAAGGLDALERYLRRMLDRGEQVVLKLHNPAGVAVRVMERARAAVAGRQNILAGDLETLSDIDAQLAVYREDVQREFQLRLSDIEAVLQGLELRGMAFFDERLRLNRLPSLFDRETVRQDFETEVVADVPAEIEQKVDALIDWLVSSDLSQWQAVVNHVNQRHALHADRVIGGVPSRFDVNRASLLETVGKACREGLDSYDRAAEASAMAESVQKAVAGTALAEAGALGLGATIAVMASSTAVDVTGLAAAGVLAVVGLLILPVKRRHAKADLHDKVGRLKATIMSGLTRQFEAEARKGLDRIRETIAPYDRFVRAEERLLDEMEGRWAALAERLDALRDAIARGFRPPSTDATTS